LEHRKDIDGLRAVAVLPVVAYHLHALPGGFVGVDVFFVISGYLISGIIFSELRQGRFTLANFYERRIRRIIPALTVLLAVVLAAAILVLPPQDAAETARQTASAALSLSNVYFTANSGYFDAPAATSPLLHTWSLAVEEQFYLLFPALALVWTRMRWSLWTLVLPVLVTSFALSAWGAAKHEVSAFYLLHSRAWELMVGAVLALAPPGRPPRWAADVVGGVGMAGILASVFLYKETMAFPGVAALLPTLGAAALIWSRGALTNRLLSLPPVVFVGLISYSLYLWHWPVFVLQRTNWLFYAGENRVLEKLIVLGLSFALAIASWWFVERPFRQRTWHPGRRALFTGAAVATLAVAGCAGGVTAAQGLPAFLPARAGAYGSFLRYDAKPTWRNGTCFADRYGNPPFDPACVRLSPTKPDILLVGDSHAAHLWYGLAHVYRDANVMQATAPSCRASAENVTRGYPVCRSLLARAMAEAPEADLVLIAGQWKPEDISGAVDVAARAQARGARVLLLGPIVGYTKALPRLLTLSDRLHDPALPARYLDKPTQETDRIMAAEARRRGVPYLSLYGLICHAQCATKAEGAPLQFDERHLTDKGSVLVATRLRAAGVTAG
jgi:peptidoglycan/LPS O-acetylase OafA/YrhL